MRLSRLLATPSLSRLLVPAEPARDSRVRSVLLAEDFEELARCPADSMAVLTRHAALSVSGERFERALRWAAEIGLAAVVYDAAAPVSTASSTIARHGGVTLLRARGGAASGEIMLAAERELLDGAPVALLRATRTLTELREAELLRRPDEELVGIVAAELGEPVSLSGHAQGRYSVPVRVGGEVRCWVSAAPAEQSLSLVTDLVLEALAGALARSAQRRDQTEPAWYPERLLAELLGADPARDVALVDRVRACGLPLDGWHVVAHLELDNLTMTAADHGTGPAELLEGIAALAVQRTRAAHPDWHGMTSLTGLTLVRMFRADPGEQATEASATVVTGALSRIRERHPQLQIHCGLGGVHAGPVGLVSSYAEARTAAADARRSARVNVPVPFQATGPRRTLADWYPDPASRYAVQTVLKPLDVLGARSTEAVRTLQCYLDNRGSLTRTAELLHLHRNSVAYRLKRIFDLLETDPEDPDDRLLLQLACRARLMR